jgi:DNA-binding GntR family transcriptional regulator
LDPILILQKVPESLETEIVKKSYSTVHMCIEELRRRIRVGALLPGEQIRQDALSTEIGVSRTPLRQALVVLASEGLVHHITNSGFFVSKLTQQDLSEVYMMRSLLERELFTSLNFDALDLPAITAIEEELEEASAIPNIHLLTTLNRRFHFAIFDASPLKSVVEVVSRLWSMSEAYRSIYTMDPAARGRVIAEHRLLIEALTRRDTKAVILLADDHRQASLVAVTTFVGTRE